MRAFSLNLALSLLLLCSSCASWRVVDRADGWTLYEAPSHPIDVAQYRACIAAAQTAVERILGPFQGPVAVHAWHADAAEPPSQAQRGGLANTAPQDVPGIGLARIQAYHARGGRGPFANSGIFLGTLDVGTAVHEFVHARLAEESRELPLWFEEGLATFLGDGILIDGEWVVDGLVCWPLRELREEALERAELERLMAIAASDQTSVKDNVLVHFLGWAVVFDLHRESASLDWLTWYAMLDWEHLAADVERRLQRTLSPHTELEWLERLDHPDPRVRCAAAKGTWKLRSREVLERLLEALREEQNDEARATLAVNALAAAGEVRFSGRRWWVVVLAALRDAQLADVRERAALLELYNIYLSRSNAEQVRAAMKQLARFWEE